jgi:hypothetical protein
MRREPHQRCEQSPGWEYQYLLVVGVFHVTAQMTVRFISLGYRSDKTEREEATKWENLTLELPWPK